MSADAPRAALAVLAAGVGCLVLTTPVLAADLSLDHAAGVESRRRQTELRIQQALRASRSGPEDADVRASREFLERSRLGDLQVRQQRQAGALDQSLRAVPPAEAGARRYRTLERYEREQRQAIDGSRQSTPGASPGESPGASTDALLPGNARWSIAPRPRARYDAVP